MSKVLLVIDSLQIGGAERHVVDLATALHDQGDEVEVACSAAGPLAGDLRARGIPLHVLMPWCVKRKVSVRYARQLRSLVGRRGPDVVHAHLYASSAAAAMATAATEVPLVVTEQTEAPWRTGPAQLASRLVYRQASAVIAVSDAIRDVLVTRYGVAGEDVRVVRNSVRPMAPRDGSARPGHTVGTIARLHPEKGLGFLLEAAPRIASAVPDVRFVLIGDGPLRDGLEADARRLGVANRFDFRGGLPDARGSIADFDVFALPSISEGTPLSIVEAMLAGVPVIASAVGGIPEQIEDRETGLLVPPRDSEALASAVTRVLTDAAFGRCLRDAARARAEVEFSHARLVERITAVYASVARRATSAALAPSRLGEPETGTQRI
jgi:glycosyltransferase involved in cell wall biosynthesis